MSLDGYWKENADDGSTKPIKLSLLAFIIVFIALRVLELTGSEPHLDA